MELSVKEFLDSVTNPNTKKEYRYGISKFCDWYDKSAEAILQERKDDLTQKLNENLIEYRNRASKFEKEIEKFHSCLLEKYAINTARTITLGIRQLFRFYEMGIRFRAGSKIAKTVKSNKNFPLTIEHVRRMFDVADLRERIILSMATDLGLRIGNFVEIKKSDLPPLDKEAPLSFDVMTGKEDVIAHGFLSIETSDLLKIYLPTLEKRENPYLFPSNGNNHISDEWLNRLLFRLAVKSKINLNNKKLTFHCFRKMFLSASIDSCIGLTAGKKLIGKSIAKSDDTYLTTINLRAKFIQLKKFLSIINKPVINADQLEALRDAVTALQEDLARQKLITDTITQNNLKTKEQLDKLNYLVEFVNHFDDYKNLKNILEFFEMDLLEDDADIPDMLRPLKVEFCPYIGLQLKKIAKTKGISEKEALREMFADDVDTMKKVDKRWIELEKILKLKNKKAKDQDNSEENI